MKGAIHMKKLCILLLALGLLFGAACAEETETVILISEEGITVNGGAIPEDASSPVYLTYVQETHEDVPEDCRDVTNRVVNLAAAGVYRVSGTAADVQLVIRAGERDEVRLILDGADLTCRTAPAILCLSALETAAPGAYGVTIELADGSDNHVAGSHTARDESGVKYDGAIDSMVSLGFAGGGSLTVDADSEGIEVKYGHLTIDGGVLHIAACDDPVNVSEDGVGVLTFNDGYLFSAVKNLEGGEGDGIDSNGSIIFNGGTAINLAHPSSMDSGIDSDMGSYLNGGVIVGAGNMYDSIESDSAQLFMMLEFAQKTEDLVVVTDAQGSPVFAYDFPYGYTYIAFSTPALKEGETYHVYLGGSIEGSEQDGLYTSIISYTPGTLMQHGGDALQQSGMNGGMPQAPDAGGAPGFDKYRPGTPDIGVDLNEILQGRDLNELLEGKDLNGLLTGFSLTDILTEEEIAQYLGDVDFNAFDRVGGRGVGGFGGMGGRQGLTSSAATGTTDFVLSRESTGFTNISAAP